MSRQSPSTRQLKLCLCKARKRAPYFAAVIERMLSRHRWIGSLPSTVTFFCTVFDRYGERLSNLSLPLSHLDEYQCQRSMIFLENMPSQRVGSLWKLYREGMAEITICSRRIPLVGDKTVDSFAEAVLYLVDAIRRTRPAFEGRN